jgi:short-subunit dehydrogenase
MTAMDAREFVNRYGRWAVVVGGSEGVGAAAGMELAARGLNLVLVARNGPLLEELADQLRGEHGVEVRTATVDLTDRSADAEILEVADGLEVGFLCYTAGAAGTVGAYLDQPLEHAQRMIQLNCSVPVALVHEFASAMVARGRGGIVLVGSTGCFAGQPYVASYSASKAFQVNLAEGLWAELKRYGVDVLSAVIGSTDTPARARRLGTTFRESVDMTSEEVAREIIEHLGDGPTRVISKLELGIGPIAGPWMDFRAFAVPRMINAMAGFTARTDEDRERG